MKSIMSQTITENDKKDIFNDLVDDFSDVMALSIKNKVIENDKVLSIIEDASHLLDFSLKK